MDKNNYELEIAYRKMAEYQRQAEYDEMVRQLRDTGREERPSLWRRLFGQRSAKPSPRPSNASLKSASATKED